MTLDQWLAQSLAEEAADCTLPREWKPIVYEKEMAVWIKNRLPDWWSAAGPETGPPRKN